MSKKITVEQEIQEKQYIKPYHYFINPFAKEGNFYFSYVEKCIEIIESFNGKRILDAGCGDGFLVWNLDDSKNEIYGLDYSQNALDFAKIFNKNKKVKFILGCLENIPFPKDYFDVVFCVAVLEHIRPQNIPVVIKEIRRVLKKDSILILAVPTPRLKKPKKHFQHFTVVQIRDIVDPLFEIKNIYGRYNFLYEYVLKLFENRLYDLKIFSKLLKKKIFYKLFAKSSLAFAEMLIFVLRKK